MTELKTLNDIFNNFPYYKLGVDGRVYRTDIADVLRAEAIKWVNYRKNKLYGFTIIKGSFNSEQVGEAIISWIKHFFNLTEEDLK